VTQKAGNKALGYLAIAALALTLTSCGTRQSATNVERTPTLYGSYLAGRFATQQRDSMAASEYFAGALAIDPGNAHLLERAMISEVSHGDLQTAALHAEELLKKSAQSRLANLVIGVKRFRDKDFAGSRAAFEQLDGKALAELGNRLGAAWTYVSEGNTDEAVKIAKRFLGAQGLEAFATYHKALIEDIGGRPQDALKTMALSQKASKGENLRVVQIYGAMLERAGRVEEAKTVYRDYLTKSPDHPIIGAMLASAEKGAAPPQLVPDANAGLAELFYSIANSLNQENAVDLSVFYIQLCLALNPQNELAVTLLGDRLQTAARWEDSNQAYGRIAAGSGLYRNARMQIANNFAKQEKTDEAVSALQKSLTGDRFDFELYAAMGDTLREKERYAEAAKAYDNAIAIAGKPDERHWILYYTRGISRERLKQWNEAEADLQFALKLKPEQPLVLNYLAYTWIEHGVNQDAAMKMLHRAVELRDDDGFIIDSLGWAYYKRGEFDKAVKYLEQAVLLEPGEATVNDHLGDAYWRVGRELEARFQWRHALTGKPDEPGDVDRIKRKLAEGLDAVEGGARSNQAKAP
jgi:tetratricopeptide (TPR) repeat protein